MFMDLIIPVFCDVDNFCINLEEYCTSHILTNNENIKYFPNSMLTLSEVMTIAIMFHLSGYRTFKHYYLCCICGQYKSCFAKLPSYNRYIELLALASMPLFIYANKESLGECTGVSFIDSTKIVACDNHRISQNKVFKDIAKRGKGSMGWFYGFKLHLVINDKGEIREFLPYARKCR